MADIKGGVKRKFLHWPDEKNHNYYAFIYEKRHSNRDALIELHKVGGSYDKNGYVFAHKHDDDARYIFSTETYNNEHANGHVVERERKISLAARDKQPVDTGSYDFDRGDHTKSFKTQWNNVLVGLQK